MLKASRDNSKTENKQQEENLRGQRSLLLTIAVRLVVIITTLAYRRIHAVKKVITPPLTPIFTTIVAGPKPSEIESVQSLAAACRTVRTKGDRSALDLRSCPF